MKISIAVLLSIVLAVQTGCYGPIKVHRIGTAQIAHPEKEQIVGVTTLKGEDVVFDPRTGYAKDRVVRAQVQNAAWQMPLSEIQTIWVERRGLKKVATIGLTAGLVVGGLALVTIILVAVKGSCPFVYSWDGTQYVFDAEPYGGAITRGLERDDFAELEHLRERDGAYRLLLTNEVDETQFTNLMELWVVDHPTGTRVASDQRGTLYTLADPQPPVAARDSLGRDLLPWLVKKDRLIWEPPAEPDSNGNLRQDIVLTFPKPEGAARAKLEVNVATGLWGSYVVKQMVQLRGRDIGEWYRQIDESQAARDELHARHLREELFLLKVYVEEPSGWVERGVVPAGGPVLAPNRIVPLDVSGVRGGELRIRIRPPAGCWALNSFAVDYGGERDFSVARIAPSSAQDQGGENVLPELLAGDDRYCAMPSIGDRAYLSFPAPPRRTGATRTVFLHSRGYYRLHLREDEAPDTAALKRLRDEPGSGAAFSAERYARWKEQSASPRR